MMVIISGAVFVIAALIIANVGAVLVFAGLMSADSVWLSSIVMTTAGMFVKERASMPATLEESTLCLGTITLPFLTTGSMFLLLCFHIIYTRDPRLVPWSIVQRWCFENDLPQC